MKFDLQFFGGTKTSTQRIPKRDPEPEGLTNLRNNLSDIFSNSLEGFDRDSWGKAQGIANNALDQTTALMGQLTGENGQLARNNALVDEIANIARTGTLPSTLTDAMNASVNQGLQSSMGSMLNGLANRGVLNSSVTTAGTNQLSQAAADAYNKNYLTAYQSVLSGMGSALQGQQNNTRATLSALGALGSIPSQAYETVGAGLTPAYNFWKDWQNFYQSDDPYDTIVTQKPSSCITGDTLVTLEDGREIPVSELQDDDKIQVWDFGKGEVSSAPLTAFVKRSDPDGFSVIRVEFEDGSNVGTIQGHLFFDLTLDKFVEVSADSQDFAGHEFAKVKGGKVIPVKVTAIYPDGKAAESYGPQAMGSWNFIAGGFITGNEGQLAMCNMFDFDGVRWDAAKRTSDLAKYGLLSYSSLEDVISRRTFDANHCEELSVAFGKGLVSCEAFSNYLKNVADYIFDKEAC